MNINKISGLVSALTEVVTWVRFPYIVSFEIIQSFPGYKAWSDIPRFLLPSGALNRKALSRLLEESTLYFLPWGCSHGDTAELFQTPHTVSHIAVASQEKYCWEGKFATKEEEGPWWWEWAGEWASRGCVRLRIERHQKEKRTFRLSWPTVTSPPYLLSSVHHFWSWLFFKNPRCFDAFHCVSRAIISRA